MASINRSKRTGLATKFQATGALAASVVALSFAGVLVKFSQASPIVVGFYRLFYTWIGLSLFWLFRKPGQHRRLLSAYPARSTFWWTVAAGVALGIHYAAWFTSLRLTSIASSTVIVSTQPLFVVIASRLLWGEALSARSSIGLVLAFLGTYVVGTLDAQLSQHHLYGDGLALIAALLMSVYFLIGRRVRQHVPLNPYMLVVYGTGSFVLAVWTLMQNARFFPYANQEWALFAALAIVPTLGGHTLFNWALRFLPASTVAVSTLGEPVGATLLGVLLLQESLGWLQVTGGAAILLGIGLFLLGKRGRNNL